MCVQVSLGRAHFFLIVTLYRRVDDLSKIGGIVEGVVMDLNWELSFTQNYLHSLQIKFLFDTTQKLRVYELIHIKNLPKVIISYFKHFSFNLKSFTPKLIDTYAKLFPYSKLIQSHIRTLIEEL